MSPSLLQEDRDAKYVPQTLMQSLNVLSLCVFSSVGLRTLFARWSGVGGVGLAKALSRFFTSSPIQLYKIRGILRANRAPALVHEQFAVV
jgi:hypothetical protein